jgi:hypothetical protein
VLIGVCVHEVNTLAHPSVPPGFRWAVHVGDSWSDLKTCLNAGWEPTHAVAAMAGEAAGVCAAKVAQLFFLRMSKADIDVDVVARIVGDGVQMRTFHLDHDPVRAGGDFVTVGG